jgi:hypothetical protein
MGGKKQQTDDPKMGNPPPTDESPAATKSANDNSNRLQKIKLILTIVISSGTIVGSIITASWYVSHKVSQIESRIERIESGLVELNQRLSAAQVDIASVLPGNWEVHFEHGDRGMLSFSSVEANHLEIHGHEDHPNKNITINGTGEIKGGIVKLNYNVLDNGRLLYSGQSELQARSPGILDGWVDNNNRPENFELITLIKRP